MFVIVDGPTCSGKSTITTRLFEHLEPFGELRLMHKSKPEEHTRRWVLNDYVLSVEDYLPAWDYNILADRWHYGEMTYSPIYRPETNKDGFGLLGAAGWRWVELFLMSRGAYGIRLDVSDEQLMARFQARGDDHVTNTSDLLALAEYYAAVDKYSPTVQRVIDTGVTDAADLDYDEIYFAALQAETASKVVMDVTAEYVGNVLPDVLLVGDKRNVTDRYGNETHLPFMPVDNSSGIFLLESLDDEFWPHVGIVNGNDTKGSLRDLWEVLGRPRPVALGGEAEWALKLAGFAEVEYSKTWHPAFARRFHHGAKKEYGLSIMAAAEEKGIYA